MTEAEMLIEIERLRRINGMLVEKLKSALVSVKEHDEAPYQCESVRGAKGAMNCREYLEEALNLSKETK